MDKENNSDVGDKSKDSSAVDTSESIESLKAEISRLKEHSDKLLSEKKSVSSKLSEYEKEKALADEKAKKEAGKWEELYNKVENEKAKIAQDFKTKVLDTCIKDALRGAGCEDQAKLEILMGHESIKSYMGKVTFNENYEPETETLSKFIEEAKEKFEPFGFFSKKAPGVKDVHVGNNDNNQASISLKDMSTSEKVNLLTKKIRSGK